MTLRSSLERVIVAGGSIAGVTAAEHLRMQGFTGEIVLVSDEQHAPYSRVPLSKAVLAGREPASTCTLPPLGDDIELRLGVPLTGLDPALATVGLADGSSLSYDGLVIATGARARSLATSEQRGEHLLRTLDHVASLAPRLRTARTVAVVGAGFLGMEVASTCLELGLEVTVIDRDPPLRRLLGTWLAGLVTARARSRGARFVRAPQGVTLLGSPGITGVGVGCEILEADVVVSAVGDVPNTGWLTTGNLPLDPRNGGVLIDSRCRVIGHDRIVAAGDVTVDGSGRSPHWMSAVRQGQAAATALLEGDGAVPLQPDPYFWTEQFGLEIKISGHIPTDGRPEVLAGDPAGYSALLRWQPDDGRPAAASVNYAIPVGKLKRLTRPRPAAPGVE